MIKVGKKPILIHIIEHYSKYGHRDFFIALGHKSQIVKNYFNKFKKLDEAFNYSQNEFDL